jgi:murein L,D-transpeptidase YafK
MFRGAGVRYQFAVLRAVVPPVAVAAVMMIAGCSPAVNSVSDNRHMQPLSESILAELKAKKMEQGSPILMRIFKEESELEVWKQDESGRFALLRTYPICRWSGELGPKIKAGDRQAPEGFYTITPGLMNPNSSRYLAINTGFPNAFDTANGRTGSFLMIHGDCSSAGCYAMTDEQIAEIYALAREAFFGGQKSFQLQAYPFRMTPLNIARHRNSPHMAFWRMIKQGYDHFEVTHLEPKVDVCEKRYVTNAEATGNFSPANHCPAYKVPEDLAAAVVQKQRRDDIETTRLVIRGIATAPVITGGAGGMNPIFRAAVKSQGGPDAVVRNSSGTIPADVNLTGLPSTSSTASAE